MTGHHHDGEEPSAKVAEHMADAVSYLSRVAKNAGLEQISSDLLAIRRKLRAKARPSVGGAERAPTRGVKRSI